MDLSGASRLRRGSRLSRVPISGMDSQDYARLDIGGIRDPEHHTYRAQLAARMAAALQRLPRAQREAFVLCAVESLSSSAVSVLVGVPENTVRTRLLHARRRLRDLLSEEHDE